MLLVPSHAHAGRVEGSCNRPRDMWGDIFFYIYILVSLESPVYIYVRVYRVVTGGQN